MITAETVAIIPALNEEATISDVVRELTRFGISKVIVVDNGSTDQTATKARNAGATVVVEPIRGYGRACLTGMDNLPPEAKWILFCDADGSDDLTDLPKLFAEAPDHDFVIGNRRATQDGRENLTRVQNFGNWLSGFLMKIGWGRGFQDLGPLRFISKTSLESLGMQDQNFGWTVEMQAKVLEQNIPFREVPVNYRPRQGGESKISGKLGASVKAGTIILSTIGSIWVKRPFIQTFITVLSALFVLLGSSLIAFYGDPASTEKAFAFFVGISLVTTGFLVGLLRKTWRLSHLLFMALGARVLLIFSAPGDDVWRYIWEGFIQSHGYNPYNLAPNAPELSSLRTEWWSLINNKEYTAIYPPLIQLIFRGFAALTTHLFSYKLLFTLADVATGVLLWKTFRSRAYLYFCNPLVLYSFAAGGHYDSLFILPLVAAWLIWERAGMKRLTTIGILIGISVSIKLVSFFAVGIVAIDILRKVAKREIMLPSGVAFLAKFACAFLIVPLLSCIIFCLLSGVPEQFAPKEFSEIARTTSLIPWICEFFNDSDFPIRNQLFAIPLLIVLALIAFIVPRFEQSLLLCLCALFAFSPMIHAWYFTWLIPFCLRRHTATITCLSLTSLLYFVQPYRFSLEGSWFILPHERLLFWSPLLLLFGWNVILLVKQGVSQIASDRLEKASP